MDKQLDLALGSLGINEPYSIEAEQAILGAALISPETVSLIIEQVRAEYFYSRQNQKIFLEIHKLFNANMPSDFITVLNSVIANGVFTDEAEAKVYLTQLAETVPSLSNVSSYAKILKDKYLVRMLLNTSTDIIKQTQNASEADVLLEYAEQKIYELRQGKDTSALSHIGLSAAESFDRLRKLSGKDREKYLGIPTGFSYLDKMLTGLGRSDLVILAARPGMGKTSFVLNIATNVAKRGMPVAVFSLEMTKEQLTSRIISAEAHIDSQIMRSGNIQVDEWDNISRAVGEISDLPIYLDDTSNVSVSDIKAKIRRLNQDPNKENVGLVVIDYLQLMSTGKRNESRVQEISEITRNLKIMAKELNVPLIVLSQLSRSAEKGQGRDARPALSDLRDSGSIEQDADVVLFLYRDAYYSQGDPDVDQSKAECIVAKNRHGEVGKVYLGWDGAHTRFYNIDFVHEDE